jgi:hypothetical protein
MRAADRSDEFRAIQRESMQVMAELRKALFSLQPSPVQGDFPKSPSPSGGRLELVPAWDICHGSGTGYLGAANVTDRRNSTLRWYLRHCRW